MNVDVSKLTPGVFGVSHGSGPAGEIIRMATQSAAGHAFLYLGNGQIVSGQPSHAIIEPADSYGDAIWAWRMWDQLLASGWSAAKVLAAQEAVVARGRALVGTEYDWPAYAAFAAEVLHLRSTGQLAGYFAADRARVCSALVDDAETAGGVPMVYVPEDGPGLIGAAGCAAIPANLVAPGMLLGLAQRMEWI